MANSVACLHRHNQLHFLNQIEHSNSMWDPQSLMVSLHSPYSLWPFTEIFFLQKYCFIFLQDPHFNFISDNILIAAIKLHDNRHQFVKKSCMLGFNYTILTFLKEYLKNIKNFEDKRLFLSISLNSFFYLFNWE